MSELRQLSDGQYWYAVEDCIWMENCSPSLEGGLGSVEWEYMVFGFREYILSCRTAHQVVSGWRDT